jgi:WD40-like Beta Propeller Repeat
VRADAGSERLPLSGGLWSPVDDLLAVPTERGFRIETPDGTILQNVDLRAVVRDTRNIDTARRGDSFDVHVGISCSVWSPDGQYLACRVAGNLVAPAQGSVSQYSGVWVVSADGSDAREVFGNDPHSEMGGLVGLYGWRRDGAAIAFSLRPVLAASLSDGLTVYEVPPLEGNVRRLEGTLLLTEGWLHGRRLEGGSLWPVKEGAGRETWTNNRIALINDSSGALTYLTDADQASIHPAWSPDGSQIAYVAGPDIGAIGRWKMEVPLGKATKLSRQWLTAAFGLWTPTALTNVS